MSQVDAFHFVKAFIRNPARVGAIAPSSPALARTMVADLAVAPGESVVEFGPGTGPFTREIQQILPTGDHYLGIERSGPLVARLQQRFPDLQFVHASAEQAATLHEQMSLPPVKAVLCGLPFASLPPAVQDGVVRCLDRLVQPGAQFRTFQYVHAYTLPTAARFRRQMNRLFGGFARSRVVWRNLPPAYVLRWQR